MFLRSLIISLLVTFTVDSFAQPPTGSDQPAAEPAAPTAPEALQPGQIVSLSTLDRAEKARLAVEATQKIVDGYRERLREIEQEIASARDTAVVRNLEEEKKTVTTDLQTLEGRIFETQDMLRKTIEEYVPSNMIALGFYVPFIVGRISVTKGLGQSARLGLGVKVSVGVLLQGYVKPNGVPTGTARIAMLTANYIVGSNNNADAQFIHAGGNTIKTGLHGLFVFAATNRHSYYIDDLDGYYAQASVALQRGATAGTGTRFGAFSTIGLGGIKTDGSIIMGGAHSDVGTFSDTTEVGVGGQRFMVLGASRSPEDEKLLNTLLPIYPTVVKLFGTGKDYITK